MNASVKGKLLKVQGRSLLACALEVRNDTAEPVNVTVFLEVKHRRTGQRMHVGLWTHPLPDVPAFLSQDAAPDRVGDLWIEPQESQSGLAVFQFGEQQLHALKARGAEIKDFDFSIFLYDNVSDTRLSGDLVEVDVAENGAGFETILLEDHVAWTIGGAR